VPDKISSLDYRKNSSIFVGPNYPAVSVAFKPGVETLGDATPLALRNQRGVFIIM